MTLKHSEYYNTYVGDQNGIKRFKIDELKNAIASKELSYHDLADLLRETNDAQFGIVSKLQDGVWLRDATEAKELSDRISHDSPTIEANNILLRCLSRLRPIDCVLGKKHESRLQKSLRENFENLANEILTRSKECEGAVNPDKLKEMVKLEEAFNTELVKALHEADLTGGCKSKEDAEKLLAHYRNLSSVIEPARPMVTVNYDKDNKILHRETQYPVTKKTEAQKKALEELKEINPYPSRKNKNAFNAKRLAFQQADSYFRDELASDDTALGAQARKTHVVGAKNAFIVKNELVEVESLDALKDNEILTKKAEEANTLWLARSGSPAFIGKGETDERILEHSKENLNQIRETAKELMGRQEELNIHVTTLNTMSPLERQATIVKNVAKATRLNAANQDDYSYVPVNPDGTFRRVDIASGLNFGDMKQPWGAAPLQKATRLESATRVFLAAAQTEGMLSLTHCASGQDRTGGVCEKSIQAWEKKRYVALEKDPSQVELTRAKGGNAAEITTHHIHGSPGMKHASIANNLFGGRKIFKEEAEREFYRKSAGTNKKNKVGDVSFLVEAPKQLDKFLDDNLLTLNLLRNQNNKGYNPEAEQLLDKIIQEITKLKDMPGLKLKDKRDLNYTLHLVTESIDARAATNKVGHQEEQIGKRLEDLATHFSQNKKGFWAKLGTLLFGWAKALFTPKKEKEIRATKGSLSDNIQNYKDKLHQIEHLESSESDHKEEEGGKGPSC